MIRTVLAYPLSIYIALILTSTGQSADKPSISHSDVKLFLRIPSALPLVNTKQKLQARICSDGKIATSGELRFFRRRGEKSIPIGKPQQFELHSGDTKKVIAQCWTPGRTGEYEILAEMRLSDKKQIAARKVTAVGRPLHFHYWHLKHELCYVTEGLMNDRKQIDYWMDRGAIPQYWKGGLCYYKDNTCKTPECFAKRWTSESTRQWPGIVIDEAGDGGKIDTILGKALVESKKLRPEMYIALYVISPGKGDYLADYRKAADRVLVETYDAHAGYGYKRIETRYQQAVDGGLGDKSLAVLGLGKFGVTTPQELRRQFHFLRYRFPSSSGIGFFGSSQRLCPAINEAIKRFFIGPVLRVEVINNQRLRVENIGATDAAFTSVLLCDKLGNQYKLRLPPLEVGKNIEVDLPVEGLQAMSDFDSDILVLSSPLLWDQEPPRHRPGATSEWPVLNEKAGRYDETFESKQNLSFEENKDENKKKDQIAATSKLPGKTSDSFELTFDLDVARAWFYSSIGIGLTDKTGDSSLNMSLYRADHEKANYLWLGYRVAGQPAVSERLAMPIEGDRKYRVKVFCQSGKYMRMAVLDGKTGDKLWDTGDIPIHDRVSFDRLRLTVRNGEGAKIAWDAQRGGILLRGSMGKQYVTSVYLDNLSITGLK